MKRADLRIVMNTKLYFLAGLVLSAAVCVSAAADASAKSDKLRFSGTVVDGSGKAVPGAVVELYQYGKGFPAAGAEMKPEQTVTTGENGAYEFRSPASATVIFARKADLAPAWASYWRPQADVTE